MVAGVGGRTVEEAKDGMSHAEAMDWRRYVNQTGPLNPGARSEWMMAQLCSVVAASNGAKKKSGQPFGADDFLLFMRDDSNEQDLSSAEGVFAALKRAQNNG